jgi:hypothetical protein
MHSNSKEFAVCDAAGDICLRVRPISPGDFGVYAYAVLIAIHPDRATADAHCQRLLEQQAQG